MKFAFIVSFALAVFGSTAAKASSADCVQPSTAIDIAICQNPSLREADQKLDAALQKAEAATLDRSSLQKDQDDWLEGREVRARSHQGLLQFYQSRIEELIRRVAAWQNIDKSIARDALAEACIRLPDAPADEACTIEHAGLVAGSTNLFYQLETYPSAYGSVVVIFTLSRADATRLIPVVAANAPYAYYEPPKLISSPFGNLLLIKGTEQGTGDFNDSALYRYDGTGLHLVDTRHWEEQVAVKLPPERQVWKGIYPDYGTMTADTSLWQPTDSNCCPTGGHAIVQLGLENNQIVVKDVTVKPEATTSPSPPG